MSYQDLSPSPQDAPGRPRRLVAALATAVLTLVWVHALAALLRVLGPAGAPLGAAALTTATLVVTLLGSLGWSRLEPAEGATVTLGFALAATLVLEAHTPGSWFAALAIAPVAAPFHLLGRRLAQRLPSQLDREAGRRPLVATLWLVLALVTLVQMGRLSNFMTDPSYDWYLSTRNPFWAKHECLPAYLFGAELTARGEPNPYDAVHYPGLNPQARPMTRVEGMVVEDPFQYPPQFLLLPRLALAITPDYATARLLWFAGQTTFFLAVAVMLAQWVGGRTGRRALLLIPLALSAFPMLHALQFGQLHLAAIALAVAAMLAFEIGRPALGGGMLALAILGKIFPGILLLPLLARRRWNALAWTAAFGLALTLVSWAVLGPAPFIAFFEYQWPRLGDGSAFAFGEAWPELRELMIADNQGAYGLATKLAALGFSPLADPSALLAVSRLYGLAVLALAGFVSLRLVHATRKHRATAWLALLGLGSMASAGAFGDYVPLTACWLLTLLATRPIGSVDDRGRSIFLAVCWLFFYTLLGTTPLGEWFDPRWMIPLSAVAVLLLFTLFGRTLAEAAADPHPVEVARRLDETRAVPMA